MSYHITATIKKVSGAESSYHIDGDAIIGVPSGTVADLKADIAVNHAGASLKVVASGTDVDAANFRTIAELGDQEALATGQKVAVLAEDGATVKIYAITLKPLAKVTNVKVSGNVGTAIESKDITIRLENTKFKAMDAGADVSAWFTNKPAGLEFKIKAPISEDAVTAHVIISGIPGEKKTEAMSIVIREMNLKSSGNLQADPNAEAVFDIKPASSAGGGNNSGSSNSGAGASSPSKPNSSAKPNAQVIKPIASVQENRLNAELSNKSVKEAIRKDKEIAKRGLDIELEAKGKAEETILNLPKEAMGAIAKAKAKELRIKTPGASVNFDLKAIEEISGKAEDVAFSVKEVNAESLNEKAKALVGNRPVYDLKLTAKSGAALSEFGGGKAQVNIPYTVKAGEDLERLTAYHIAENGALQEMKDARYDEGKKAVIFTTEHFSVYAVGEKAKTSMFTDIASHWAKDEIAYVAEKGLMKGVSAETFNPKGAMERGMFVTVIGRMAGADPSSYKAAKFSDVDKAMYYAPYVAWAVEKGIVKGMSETTFMPEAKVTREQMALMMEAYAKEANIALTEKNEVPHFADEETVSDWAKDAVNVMRKAGILSGKEGNKFDPKGTASRAEAAKIIYTLMKMK